MKSKIKVLHIIKSLGRGGAETLLAETLKQHDRNRFEFHYIYFLPWKDQLVGDLEEAGGIVHCFSAKNNMAILFQYRQLIKYVRQNNIQIIHAHLPWAGFVARVVFKLTGIPVIYTEHNKQERYHGVTFLLNRLTFRWQRLVIAVSEDVKASIQKKINPSIPVKVILNGVDTDRFVRNRQAGTSIRQRYNIPETAIVVGTIAVFRFQKRLCEWLEVAKAIQDKHENVYFIIVGDGPLKNEIREKQRLLDLERKVIIAGLQEDVKPWLSAFDIYMMSSEFEGLPVALLEAMSMACAIVSTDAGGIKEVIQHTQQGLLVRVEDWPTLAQEVTKLLDDPALRNQLGQAARQRVEERFSVKRMVDELEEVYEGVVGRGQ